MWTYPIALIAPAASMRRSRSRRIAACFSHDYTSRLDYCNSMLADVPKSTIAPLEKVQNASARPILFLLKPESSYRNPSQLWEAQNMADYEPQIMTVCSRHCKNYERLTVASSEAPDVSDDVICRTFSFGKFRWLYLPVVCAIHRNYCQAHTSEIVTSTARHRCACISNSILIMRRPENRIQWTSIFLPQTVNMKLNSLSELLCCMCE